MNRPQLVLVAVLAVIAAACGGGATEPPGDPDSRSGDAAEALRDGSAESSAAAAVDASTIEFVADPVTLSIDGVDYWAGSDRDGCVTLLVAVDDNFYAPLRRCERPLEGYWQDTVSCAFQPEPVRDDSSGGGLIALPPCGVEIPPVVVGHEFGNPDLLCLAAESETGFGSVHFIEPNADNLWLAAVPLGGVGYAAFAYTTDGRHYGEAPIDGGASQIWAMCDAAGPWSQVPPPEVRLTVMLRFGRLAAEAGGLFYDFGSGSEWVSFDFGEDVFIEVTTFSDVGGVDLAVFEDLAAQTPLGFYPYPDELMAELTSGWVCPDAPSLLIEVGPAVLAADPAAIKLGVLTPAETADLGGPTDTITDRRPGEPCPDTGTRRSSAEQPSAPARLLETVVVWDLDDSWLGLGSDWSLVVLHEVSQTDRFGNIADLGFLADHPEENRHVELIGPGSVLRVGILPTAETEPDDPRLITLEVPPLPEEPLVEFEGKAVLDLVIGPGQLDPVYLDAGMIELSWRSG